MKTKLLAFLGFIFLIVPLVRGDNYTTTLYFEQTESALNALLKTQVFPHPEGVHYGDQFDIYIWDQSINLEPGVAHFSCTVHADLVIDGEQTTYEYPLNLTLNIPSVNLSLNGITTFLEGIPQQIQNLPGPQWVKDKIVDAYENLQLTMYPNKVIDNANASIPDELDITVNDFGLSTPDIQQDKIVWSINSNYDVNDPNITGWFKETSDHQKLFKFHSNVHRKIIKIKVYRSQYFRAETIPNDDLNADDYSPVYTFSPDDIQAFDYYYVVVWFGPQDFFTKIVYRFLNTRVEHDWQIMTMKGHV